MSHLQKSVFPQSGGFVNNVGSRDGVPVVRGDCGLGNLSLI